MIDTFTGADFHARVGEAFTVSIPPDRTVKLDLIEVRDGGSGAAQCARDAGLRAPFSILFRGHGDTILPQQTYRIENENMGRFDLFLVAVAECATGFEYEAVFA